MRENREGALFTLVYGCPVSTAVDPIEKKPLFHFLPGSKSLSLATVGCNFTCAFCQNADISQMPRDHGRIVGSPLTPEQVVQQALDLGCASISYTYTEPTIYYEYARDCARPATAAGLKNVFVTSGYISPEPLRQVAPYLDAVNIDLKSFRDETYRRYAGARLQPVLDSLANVKRLGIWLEVTTLVIPDLNDDPAELRETARFITHLGSEVPWHLARFMPAHRMSAARETPLATLEQAREIGREEGLCHVYIENVPTRGTMDTVCPSCGRTLIVRRGFAMVANDTRSGACPDCGTVIAGVNL